MPRKSKSPMRRLPDHGVPNKRFSNLGVWTFGLGPGSPVPSDRLKLGIIDETGAVIRRFEQIEGRILDPGYVDFFMGPNCRPSVREYPLVDIDASGEVVATLHPNFTPRMDQNVYIDLVRQWANKWGRPEYAIGSPAGGSCAPRGGKRRKAKRSAKRAASPGLAALVTDINRLTK